MADSRRRSEVIRGAGSVTIIIAQTGFSILGTIPKNNGRKTLRHLLR